MIFIRVKTVCLIAVLPMILALAPTASTHGVLAAIRCEQGTPDATAAEHYEFDRQSTDLHPVFLSGGGHLCQSSYALDGIAEG